MYRKTVQPRYKLQRAHNLRSQATHVKGAVGVPQPPKTDVATVANVNDVTYFLAKYLSGKQNVMVTPVPKAGFEAGLTRYAGKPYYGITVPEWDKYDLPVKNAFDKYRIYRSGVWHESCHVRHTPEYLYRADVTSAEHRVLNILEDKRVEDLGVKDWPGYLPERLYAKAYAYAVRPDVSTIYDSHEPSTSLKNKYARFEAFLQRMLIGKVKGALPPQETQLIEDTADYAEKELAKTQKPDGTPHPDLTTKMIDLTKEVAKRLNITSKVAAPPDYDHTFHQNFPAKSKQEVDKEMHEFFKAKRDEAKKDKRTDDGKVEATEITKEDVDVAEQGTAEVQNEFAKIQRKQPIDPTIPLLLAPVTSQLPAEKYRNAGLIAKLNTALREWRTGYRTLIGESGASLSIPDYIRDKEKPFTTRLKQSVHGKKLLVIADFSASQSDRENAYKGALISAMEVLDKIGSKTAFFGFGEEPSRGPMLFFTKRFEEPKWTSTHSNKVAAITSGGTTPTNVMYELLKNYIAKHKPEAVITVTDGQPDSATKTKEALNELRKHTRMVAFGIAEPQFRDEMEKALAEFRYHKSFVVTNLNELPPKLVHSILPE